MNKVSWLLVDNDEEDREIFQIALADAAPSILLHTASGGSEAINKIQNELPSPELIFLDINMPLMNGFECLKKIRNETRAGNVPVYMYSTSNDPADIKLAFDAGATGYIHKPSDIHDLIYKLRQLAELH